MSMHRIPNGLVISLVAAFYLHAVLTGMAMTQMVAHTATAMAYLIVMMIVGGAIGLGAGVIKLLSAGVLWLGHSLGLMFVILAFVGCGLAALTWATIKQDSNIKVPMLPFAAVSALVVVQFGDRLSWFAS